MKQVKRLLLVGCLSFVIHCTTAPPVQVQENGQTRAYLMVTGKKSSTIHTDRIEVNDEHSAYHKMNEETFINLLNADSDTLSLIEGIWSNDKNTYKIGIKKAGEKGTYNAFILNSREPTMNEGEIIAVFYESISKYMYFTEFYLEDNTKVITKAHIDEYGVLQIYLEKLGKENAAFFRNDPVKEASEEEKIPDVRQSLAREVETGNDEYYVQVISSKNQNDMQKLLVTIKKYYPEAYIVVHNNFSKIRIPGILTKKQGAMVTRNIEKKFNLKPMLVLKKR